MKYVGMGVTHSLILPLFVLLGVLLPRFPGEVAEGDGEGE
jgi:hypothetical protein